MSFAYFTVVSIIGGLIIWSVENSNTYFVEQGGVSFVDALFTSASIVAGAGLTVIDFSRFTKGSQLFALVLMQLSSLILLTLPIVFLKRYYIRQERKRKILERKDTNTLELNEGPIHHLLNEQELEEDIVHFEDDNKNKDTITTLTYEKEYKAMGKLIIIVILYYVIVQFIGFVILLSYFGISSVFGKSHLGLTTNGEHINIGWWSFFHIISAFTNTGLSLNYDSLTQFLTDRFVLIVIALMVIMGNTGFPIFLRLSVWIARKYSRDYVPYKYLLIKPRDVYTHLFPPLQTRTLIFLWTMMLFGQFFTVLILDYANPYWDIYTGPTKFFIVAFQSAITRTAGFSTIDLSVSEYGVQVLYVLLMYISAFPLVLALRRSGKHIKKASEIYIADQEIENAERTSTEQRIYAKVKKSLMVPLFKALAWWTQTLVLRDVSWLFLAIFFICSIESDNIMKDTNFSVFKIIFELAGAYGTVGLSLGYPGIVTSFCTKWSTRSKLICIFVLLLGRCRGLPDSLDYAVDFKKYKNKKQNISDNNKQEQQGQQQYSNSEITVVELLKKENKELKECIIKLKREAAQNSELFFV